MQKLKVVIAHIRPRVGSSWFPVMATPENFAQRSRELNQWVSPDKAQSRKNIEGWAADFGLKELEKLYALLLRGDIVTIKTCGEKIYIWDLKEIVGKSASPRKLPKPGPWSPAAGIPVHGNPLFYGGDAKEITTYFSEAYRADGEDGFMAAIKRVASEMPMTFETCKGCRRKFVLATNHPRRYCTDRCAQRVRQRRFKERHPRSSHPATEEQDMRGLLYS